MVHRDGDDSYVGSGEESEGGEGSGTDLGADSDEDDPVRLLRKTTGAGGDPLSATERIAMAVKSQSPEARAERIKQVRLCVAVWLCQGGVWWWLLCGLCGCCCAQGGVRGGGVGDCSCACACCRGCLGRARSSPCIRGDSGWVGTTHTPSMVGTLPSPSLSPHPAGL